MPETLQKEVRELLDRPNFVHLSTLLPDGSPSNTPVWIGLEDDRIVIGTEETSLKARNMRRDPRVAISVIDFDNPYEEAQIRGRAVEFRDDSSFAVMDAISHKYTGKPFPFRNPAGRVTIVIEVEKTRYRKIPIEHTPPEVEQI